MVNITYYIWYCAFIQDHNRTFSSTVIQLTSHHPLAVIVVVCLILRCACLFCQQIQHERDELYQRFIKAIHEVQQKSNFKNLLLEKKLSALADTLEKKEAQLNEVLSASNLDPTALTVVTRKLEVSIAWALLH